MVSERVKNGLLRKEEWALIFEFLSGIAVNI